MKLVAAKCPSCGAQIDVDKDSDSTVCEFCRTKIIVDEAIQKHKVELSGEVEVKNLPKLENLLKLGDRHYNDKEYDEAFDKYNRAYEIDPDNYIAVLRRGLSKSYLSTFENFEINSSINAIKNALEILHNDKKDDSQTVTDVIVEGEDIIDYLVKVLVSFYNNNTLTKDEVIDYIDKLGKCIHALEVLYNIADNKVTKNILIDRILSIIEIIFSKKVYFPGTYDNKGRLQKFNFMLKPETVNKYVGIKKKYLEEKEKLNPKPVSENSNVNVKKTTTNNKFTFVDIICYTFVVINGFLSLMALDDNMVFTFLFAGGTLVAYLPPMRDVIVGKKNNKWLLVLLRVLLPILTLFVFELEITPSYVGTFENQTISIETTKDGNITITNGSDVKQGNYAVSEAEDGYLLEVNSNGAISYYLYNESNNVLCECTEKLNCVTFYKKVTSSEE